MSLQIFNRDSGRNGREPGGENTWRGECDRPEEARRTVNPESGYAFLGDAGVLLDARARAAYRRRLAEIDEDLEEARLNDDIQRQAQATTEREVLVRELSRAVGLGGRDRRAGSAQERTRVSVTRAIRTASDRIRVHSLPLAEHLDHSIRTGTRCAYLPASRGPDVWIIRGETLWRSRRCSAGSCQPSAGVSRLRVRLR